MHWLRLVAWALLLSGMAVPAAAQDTTADPNLDQEARALFEAGSTAFRNARYEQALDYFRRAYELSGRPGLLYNVGLAADRLRRDREALEAFEGFLAQVPEHPRRRDVEVRVAVLRRTIAEEAAEETAVETESEAGEAQPEREAQATLPAPSSPPLRDDGEGTPVVLPIALGVAGAAGIAAAIVGIVSSDDCLTEEAGVCIEERTPSWAPVAIYGGLGVAAIAGAVLWLALGGSDQDRERAPVSVTARGLSLGWSL